jgi:DNA invertase Pin-like site-specific DNA recombinase
MDTLNHGWYDDSAALLWALRRHAVQAPTRPTTLAYSYLRFSTPAQADGDSTRRQTALRDGWLKRNPLVKLDTSLSLVDAGVSGYRGEHRTNKKHDLALFVDLVERGRVPAGSYLIVENLDRLTREAPMVAVPAVMNLVTAGIQVVQLSPDEMVYHSGMSYRDLREMLDELARGHGESKRKSGLCSAAWGEKKVQARDKQTPHGAAVPAWLELAGGKYRVKEDAGRAVRLIFAWSAEGLGTLAITRRLTAEGVRPIARGDKWVRSYVAKILDNPATVGTYTPMKGHRGRKPDGEPVENYFPAVVNQAEWAAAHNARANRHGRSGRKAAKGVSLFSGLVRCARDVCPLHVITRKGKKYLVSSRAVNGDDGAHWHPFSLDVFNRAVLSKLSELQAADLFADPGQGRQAELQGKLSALDKRLAVATERFEADPESGHWQGLVGKYDRERREVAAELADERQRSACPLSASWAETLALMEANDPERLRAGLLATVESVECVLVGDQSRRLAAVQVRFKGDGGHRDYLVSYQPMKPAKWEVLTFASPGVGPLDFRKAKDVGKVVRVLESMELAPKAE